MKDFEIRDEIKRLEQELIDRTEARVVAGLDATAKQLEEIEAEKRYRKAADLYEQFKEAEAAVKNYAADIEKSGQLAEDPAGNTFHIKTLASGTAVTFAKVHPGMVLDVAGGHQLVKSVKYSYLGNKAELVPLKTKAYVNNDQTATPSHFDPATKTLEVPRSSALRPTDAVTIHGVKYIPAALVGPQSISCKYELKEAA